jgi:hypothetical protein
MISFLFGSHGLNCVLGTDRDEREDKAIDTPVNSHSPVRAVVSGGVTHFRVLPWKRTAPLERPPLEAGALPEKPSRRGPPKKKVSAAPVLPAARPEDLAGQPIAPTEADARAAARKAARRPARCRVCGELRKGHKKTRCIRPESPDDRTTEKESSDSHSHSSDPSVSEGEAKEGELDPEYEFE